MKLEEGLSTQLTNALESEAIKALHDVVASREYAALLPMHTSNMNIEIFNSSDSRIAPVIIPPLYIYIDPEGYLDDKVAQRYIGYRIAYDNSPFPLSHVFSDSGYLCLGTIFVPELVSKHNPQQPLETLFLANDRNMAHGHPIILPSTNDVFDIKAILSKYQLLNSMPKELCDLLDVTTEKNWAVHDVLWQLTNYLLSSTDKQTAFKIADQIFQILF